jgi:hypothetical protein
MPLLLWHSKIHCHVHKSPPLDPILRHANLYRIISRDILIFSPSLCLGIVNGVSGFLTKIIHAFLIIPIHVICRATVFVLYFFRRIRDSSVSISTGYGLGGPGSIPGVQKFFSSPQRPDRLWGAASLLSNGYRG